MTEKEVRYYVTVKECLSLKKNRLPSVDIVMEEKARNLIMDAEDGNAGIVAYKHNEVLNEVLNIEIPREAAGYVKIGVLAAFLKVAPLITAVNSNKILYRVVEETAKELGFDV